MSVCVCVCICGAEDDRDDGDDGDEGCEGWGGPGGTVATSVSLVPQCGFGVLLRLRVAVRTVPWITGEQRAAAGERVSGPRASAGEWLGLGMGGWELPVAAGAGARVAGSGGLPGGGADAAGRGVCGAPGGRSGAPTAAVRVLGDVPVSVPRGADLPLFPVGHLATGGE